MTAKPSQTSARADVLDIIGQSVFHAMGLLESLKDETAALETENPEALLKAIDAKQGCVAELQELDERRRGLCLEAGFKDGPFQMEELAAWCDQDRVILNRWDHLMEVAAECNARNLTNGSILRTRQQHIHSNLAVLRGDDIETHTYHRDGKNGPGHQVAIAKA